MTDAKFALSHQPACSWSAISQHAFVARLLEWRLPACLRVRAAELAAKSTEMQVVFKDASEKLVGPSRAQSSRAQSAPRSLRRALLTPQVNTGSCYRCGKST